MANVKNLQVTHFKPEGKIKAFANKVNGTISLEDYFNMTWLSEEPSFIEDIDKLRNLYESRTDDDKLKDYKDLKEYSSCVKFAGTFSKHGKDNLIDSSFLMFVDIDENDNPKLTNQTYRDKVLNRLKSLEYTVGTAKSNNHYGIRWVVLLKPFKYKSIDELQEYYNQAYARMDSYCDTNMDIKIDEQCKDLNRNCFDSYDTNSYINYEAKHYGFNFIKPVTRKVTKSNKTISLKGDSNAEKIISYTFDQISLKGGNPFSDYATWLQLAQLIKYALDDSDLGRAWFYKYSMLDSKPSSLEACNKKYDSISLKDGVGVGTFIYEMKKTFDIDYSDLKTLTDFIKTESIKSQLHKDFDIYRNVVKEDYFWKRDKEKTFRLFKPIESLNSIHIDLEGSLCTAFHKSKLEKYIYNEEIKQYNPLKDAFNSLIGKWDGKDHLSLIHKVVKTDDDELFQKFFTKWYCNMIHGVYEKKFCNEMALVLIGAQNDGKSYFFENLLPEKLDDYVDLCENFNPEEKYDKLKLCTNLLVVLDEMATYSKSDLSILKATLTAKEFKLDKKYMGELTYKRYASVAGTTNSEDFLMDYTGDRRYSVFNLTEEIDRNFDKIDKQQLLAQMLKIYFTNDDWKYTSADKLEMIDRNADNFTYVTTEEEILKEHLDPSVEYVYTQQEITDYLNKLGISLKMTSSAFGKVLKRLGYDNKRVGKKRIRRYNCVLTHPKENGIDISQTIQYNINKN